MKKVAPNPIEHYRPRIGGRSARVVCNVLQATLEELSLRGYGALSVEDIAAQAGVNKTTIYRRWPTKADLVRAALCSVAEEQSLPAESRSFEAELLHLMHTKATLLSSPQGRGIARALFAENMEPEVAALAQSLRKASDALPIAVIKRAIERGELPQGTDPKWVVELLLAPLYRRILVLNKQVARPFLVRLINFVVLGAKQGGAIRTATLSKQLPVKRTSRTTKADEVV